MEIPSYIQEEICKFIEEKKNGKIRFTTYENIKSYINLAKKAGRITEEQAIKIEKMIKINSDWIPSFYFFNLISSPKKRRIL